MPVNFKDFSRGTELIGVLLVDIVYVLGTVFSVFSVFSEGDERGVSVSLFVIPWLSVLCYCRARATLVYPEFVMSTFVGDIGDVGSFLVMK